MDHINDPTLKNGAIWDINEIKKVLEEVKKSPNSTLPLRDKLTLKSTSSGYNSDDKD